MTYDEQLIERGGCPELVWVRTEDGQEDGRCLRPITDNEWGLPMCPMHAQQIGTYRDMSEAEKLALERAEAQRRGVVLMPTTLTNVQADMLRLLKNAHVITNYDGAGLARMLYNNHRTPQGAVQTASSLVRRGLAEKVGRNPVRYRIEGLRKLAAHEDYVKERGYR